MRNCDWALLWVRQTNRNMTSKDELTLLTACLQGKEHKALQCLDQGCNVNVQEDVSSLAWIWLSLYFLLFTLHDHNRVPEALHYIRHPEEDTRTLWSCCWNMEPTSTCGTIRTSWHQRLQRPRRSQRSFITIIELDNMYRCSVPNLDHLALTSTYITGETRAIGIFISRCTIDSCNSKRQ